jgi:Holliday junction DNA helicase RuvB
MVTMAEEERVTNPSRKPDDRMDQSLRPANLSELIGQDQVRKNLEILIAAAKGRKECLDHVLFYGPPGLGKTTLAHILANEMGVNIKITSGPAIERTGDLAAILTNLR